MDRKKGIVIILVGIGLMVTSLLFASGHNKHVGLSTNISRMDIVFVKGEYIKGLGNDILEELENGHWEGRVAIPLKVCLSISILFILTGTGIILLSSKNLNSADNAKKPTA